VASLDAQRVDAVWFHVIESELATLVLILGVASAGVAVADVVEVPTGDAGKAEDYFIAGLIVAIKTGAIDGAANVVVLKGALGKRRCREDGETAKKQAYRESFGWG
jgi:hypothetical protein